MELQSGSRSHATKCDSLPSPSVFFAHAMSRAQREPVTTASLRTTLFRIIFFDIFCPLTIHDELSRVRDDAHPVGRQMAARVVRRDSPPQISEAFAKPHELSRRFILQRVPRPYFERVRAAADSIVLARAPGVASEFVADGVN